MGSKRIGLLIAILATFAVLATMGNQLVSKSANAVVTGPTLECTPDGDVAFPGTDVTGGSTISCIVTSGTGVAGDLTVLTTVPNTTPTIPDPNNACDALDDGTETFGANSLSCVYDGPASTSSSYAGVVDAQPNCADDLAIAVSAVATDSDSDSDSDTEQFNIETPCLSVDKSVEIVGGVCTLPCAGYYDITIVNSGTVGATDVGFVDELDDRLFVTSVTDTSAAGGCTVDNASPDGPLVTCSGMTVAGPGITTVRINFSMSLSDEPIDGLLGDLVENGIDNTAPGACVTADNVSAGGSSAAQLCDQVSVDPGDEGPLDDATFLFGGEASALLTKVASPSSVTSTPFQEFDWIFQITNTGTVPLTELTLVDGQLNGGVVGSIDAVGQTFTGSLGGACVVALGLLASDPDTLNCTFKNGAGVGESSPITQLNPGESITVVVHMVSITGALPQTITNTADFDADEIDTVTSTGTLVIDNNPELTITKAVDGPTVGGVGSGDPGAFIITIENVGGDDATGAVLTDVVPAGLVVTSVAGDCSNAGNTISLLSGTITAGDTLVCTVNVVLADGIVSALTSFLNTATVTADGGINVSASASIQASVPDLSLVKISSGEVSASEDVTFTITVTNNGNADAANVDITDLLPDGLTLDSIVCPTGFTPSDDDCLDGTIDEGEFVVVTIVAFLDDLTIENGTILTNVATVTADNATGSMDAAQTEVDAPALVAVKTNAPTLIGQDGVVTSTIVVTNSGSEPLTSVSIVDTLPAGTTYVASGSTASCSAAGLVVTCVSNVALPVGGSRTFTVRFNVNETEGVITNTVVANGYIGEVLALSTTAQASVTVVEAADGGLVHVDVDAAAESAAHGESETDENQALHDPGDSELDDFLQDDIDDATGSLHTVCLISSDLGLDDDANIVWSILPTPGSNATVSPAGGTKDVLVIDDLLQSDDEANCVSWRSAGTGGQTITATDTLTDTVYYLYGTDDTPLVKEWNDIDSTKIVSAFGNIGSTIFGNEQDLASWTSLAFGGTCVRDANVSSIDVNCIDRANLDGTTVTSAGSTIVTGGNAGNIIAGGMSFIEYAFGDHADYSGPIDGVQQTFTVGGTCGSVLVENPVTGDVEVLYVGDSVTIINSDKGVGFQILPTDDGSDTTDTGNADCSPNEVTSVTITSEEDVQLRSDFDTAPAEIVTVRWIVAPPPQKQILLAWAGQRVILEHDWRISGTGRAYDVDSTEVPAQPAATNICPVSDGTFWVHFIRGAGPGNFLPSLGAEITGNDDAWVEVDDEVDQVEDNNDIEDGNENCISRVLYESEDPGQVDIEAFIDGEEGLNLSKIAFVIYYMKFESIELSIVDQVSKPNHNAPSKTVSSSVLPYETGDYAPGNPWDASDDNASGEAEWNVSADLLIRGRVKGWFLSSNPSGRLEDRTNALNFLPANRWVMPDDWALLAGGPDGEDVKGTAEEFRPGYDIMVAPNSGLHCDTPWGACSETTTSTTVGTVTTITQSYNIPGPIEGPYSLLDLVGPLSAALSNYDPTTVRNTIIRDFDVDYWDAPMPAAPVSIDIRGSGFVKQVLKENVYWTGTVNGHYGSPTAGGQDFTNPFYMINVPDSAFIPATAAGGGFLWDSFGPDGVGDLGQGVYKFWTALPQFLGYGRLATDKASASQSMGFVSDATLTDALRAELAQIRIAYGALSTDPIIAAEARSIGRALVVFTDNHGEFMLQANGDFNLTYEDCDLNVFGGGNHCAEDDLVGASTLVSTVDYPDFRGKHFPVKSNSVSVDWTWGGYKEVTIEDGETDQFKYIVFRALDRDGFCSQRLPGSVSLHPVLSAWDDDYTVGANDPIEYVDFLIDAGEGIIVNTSGGSINDGKQFATGVPTFSTLLNPTVALGGIKEFAPLNDGTDECQAWIRVSNSLLGILNVMTTAYDDEGDIGFDRIIDFSSTASYELTFRWSLITWAGQDGISPTNALKGTVGDGANDIFDQVTAVYGWNQASQSWLGFFPAGVSVPGANDLTALQNGQAYWIAIKGPNSVTWTIGTDVN